MPALFRSLSLWIAVVLAIPTSLILVTWNTLPGQTLYPVKRGLEEGPRLAFHLAGSKTAADYEVYLADRRFSEAITLVKSDNTLGLTELTSSLKTTEQKVIETQNDQAREKLVQNLIAYDQKLETQKVALQTSPTPSTSPTSPTTPTTGQTTSPVPPPLPAATTTATSIDNTQKEIKNIIDDLKKNQRSTTRTGIKSEGNKPKTNREDEKDQSDKKSQNNFMPGEDSQQSPNRDSKHDSDRNNKSKNLP